MRGQPRTEYERTYILLPQQYIGNQEWAAAAASRGNTVGYSADDAGIGDLNLRKVLAINPFMWPGDLKGFFDYHYPGVQYQGVSAISAKELRAQMMGFPIRGVHDLGGAEWLASRGLQGWCVEPVYLGDGWSQDRRVALWNRVSHLEQRGIRVLLNLRYSWAVDNGGQGTIPPPSSVERFVESCCEMMESVPVTGFILCNEVNNPREWPRGFQVTPEYYIDFYNAVSDKAIGVFAPSAIDPYNGGWGDWRQTWRHVYDNISICDFIALHAYTHGPELSRIRSVQEFSDDPLRGVYYDLRVLENQLKIIPERLKQKMVIVTETNHLTKLDGTLGWETGKPATDWIKAMYTYMQEMDVAGACTYRFEHDEWSIGENQAVLQGIVECEHRKSLIK